MKSHLWMTFSLAASIGCGSDADDGLGPSRGSQPAYVLSNEVYTADETTSYLHVLGSLDADELDYDRAIEFAGGRATFAVFDGWLFVAPPDRPVITRYAVADDGSLTEDGEIGLGNFGLESVWIDEWGNTFVSPTKAYLNNSDDGTTIVWNPTTMEITGEIAPLEDLVRGDLSINGSPGVVRDGRLYRTFFWSDWEAWETSSEQYVAVYDVEADEMIDLIAEERCPGLSNRVERDDDGALYFSNWVWNVPETLISGAPASCAVRIAPGDDAPDSDWTLPFVDVTDGRQAAMLAVSGDGRGSLNVFHDERAEFDADSDPIELASTANWRLWDIDLEGGVGEPVEGLDFMTGGASTFHLDGRSFVFIPEADYTTTRVYELEDGEASPHLDVEGWSYQFSRLR